MAKTNWQDPRTGEIISPDISGLQESVGKIEESIAIESTSESDIPLLEVFVSNDDRCRIYQAPEGKRNWVLSPAPIIKKNGVIITDDFEINYGGGAVVFTTPILESDALTADATFTKKIEGKQLSTNDYNDEEKLKNQSNEDNIKNLAGENRTTETVKGNADSILDLIAKVGNTDNLDTEEKTDLVLALNEVYNNLVAHKADMVNRGFIGNVSNISEMDLNDILSTGFYGGNNLTNAPTQSYYYIEVVSYNGSGLVKQTATQVTGVDAGRIWERVKNTNWESWYRIYTDKPIPLIDATLQNGWLNVSSSAGLKYFKDAFGVVHISGEIRDGLTTTGTMITTLPIGYRPRGTIPIPVLKSNDGTIGMFQIGSDGSLMIHGNAYTSGFYRINGSFRAV